MNVNIKDFTNRLFSIAELMSWFFLKTTFRQNLSCFLKRQLLEKIEICFSLYKRKIRPSYIKPFLFKLKEKNTVSQNAFK